MVEFPVSMVRELGDGYVEKYIDYLDMPSPYKAVIYKNQLVAIVSRTYKVVTHGQVEAVLKEAGLNILDKGVGVRRAWWVVTDGRYRYLVVNSVDGSLAFKIYLFEGYPFVHEYVYRRHTKGLDVSVESVREYIESMTDVVKDYEEFMSVLSKVDRERFLEGMSFAIKRGLPRRFDYSFLVRWGREDVRDVYMRTVKAIWNDRKLDILTKMRYFKILLDTIASVLTLDWLV